MAKSFGSFVRFAGGGLRPLTSPWGFSRLALRGAGQGATRPCTPCLLFLERVGRKLRHATSGQNPRMAPLCAGAADCPRCAGGRYTEVPWLARRAGRLRPFPRLATPGFCPPFANAATGCRVVAAVWGRGAAEIGCGCGLPMFRRQQTPPLPAQLYCAVRGAGGHPLLALRSLTPPPTCRKVAVVWVWGVAEIGCGCGLPMFRRQQTPPLPAQLYCAVRGAGGHHLLALRSLTPPPTCRKVAVVWGRGTAEIGCGCGLSMFRRQQTPLSLRSPGCRGSPPACPALYRRGKNGYTMNGIFGPFQEGC